MDQVLTFTDQLRFFASQHLPPEAFNVAAAVAGAAVILGIIISVAGAKLAKAAFTVGMMMAGVGAASIMAPSITAGTPPWVLYLLGGVVGAVLGFLLFRVWVGGIAAAVFGLAAIAYAGHAQVLPALERMNGDTVTVASTWEPTVPTVAQQQTFQRLSVSEFNDRFWSEVQAIDPAAPARLRVYGWVAGVVGFVIGLLLSRLTLVLCTSLVGTGLLMFGLFYLGQTFWPDAVQQMAPHGRSLLIVMGAFLLMSLVLQGRLTQPTPKAAKTTTPPAAIPV